MCGVFKILKIFFLIIVSAIRFFFGILIAILIFLQMSGRGRGRGCGRGQPVDDEPAVDQEGGL